VNDCGAADYTSGTVTQTARVDVRESDSWTSTSITVRGKPVVLLSTAGNYAEASARGVHCGLKFDEVEKIYGAPSYVLSETRGITLMYRGRGMAIHLGRDGRVSGWTLFEEE
jgi:hypothetical protein